jgi:hypothetical protein
MKRKLDNWKEKSRMLFWMQLFNVKIQKMENKDDENTVKGPKYI